MAIPISQDPAEPFIVPALPDPPVKPKGRPGAQVREERCVSALVSEGLSFARFYWFVHFCIDLFCFNFAVGSPYQEQVGSQSGGQVGGCCGDGEALLGTSTVPDPLAFHSSPIS